MEGFRGAVIERVEFDGGRPRSSHAGIFSAKGNLARAVRIGDSTLGQGRDAKFTRKEFWCIGPFPAEIET